MPEIEEPDLAPELTVETMLELLPSIRSLGPREAIRFSDGIRTEIWASQDLDGTISRFAAYLTAKGLGPGARLLLWSENRPEWIAVFWACFSQGAVVVPVDASSTPASNDMIPGVSCRAQSGHSSDEGE
jgi:acyl-CoA synthetase (AMP-forming)/AMP-acid ligase II